MLPAASNQLPLSRTSSDATLIETKNSPISCGSPRPRPRAHSNFFQASAYSIKALFRRALCTLKECGLSEKARTQRYKGIKLSIQHVITKKYELK